jgi:hypothetical protein
MSTMTRCWWLTPVILPTQEAEIRRIVVQSHPGEIVHEILSRKKNPSQKRADGVAEGVGPEFKPQKRKKKKHNVTLYCSAEKLSICKRQIKISFLGI